MGRLFLKTFYTFFLWILLLANLFIFFDMTSLILNPLAPYTAPDLSNSYFGVSTFINAFKTIDTTPFGKFVLGLGGMQKELYRIATEMFSTSTIDDIITSFSTSSNVIDVLKSILKVITGIARASISSALWVFAIGYTIFYYLTLVLNFAYYVIGLVGGQYITPVPDTGLLDDMIVAGNISNCITPLLSVV